MSKNYGYKSSKKFINSGALYLSLPLHICLYPLNMSTSTASCGKWKTNFFSSNALEINEVGRIINYNSLINFKCHHTFLRGLHYNVEKGLFTFVIQVVLDTNKGK